MSSHDFGGLWTAQKLDILREYLEFFPIALGGRFKLVYIDTFAGTGKCTIKTGPDGKETIEGSATIALNVARPFDEYFFIEARRKHVRALRLLKDGHPLGDRVHITHGDARQCLTGVLARHDWKASRGVLFLDPYGLQCTWDMVKAVASTKALDVFFLVSVSGLTRQAATSAAKIDAGKAAALDRFLGTSEWRTALYKPPATLDLFGDEQQLTRDQGTDAIIQFVQERMETTFPMVKPPVVLRSQNGAPLYALFFAVANPHHKARELADKVVKTILNKLR
jgi:three-Cys-motif partner protein